MIKVFISFLFAVLTFGAAAYLIGPQSESFDRPCISQLSQVQELFPTTKMAVEQLVKVTKQKVMQDLEKIYESLRGKPTFDSTFRALDRAAECCKIAQSSLYVLSITGQKEPLHTAAREGLTELQKFYIDELSLNQKLYAACSHYVDFLKKQKHEILSPVQQYFLEEVMREFRRNGLQLPKEIQNEVRAIQKEQAELTSAYDAAYINSNETVDVPLEGLKGLEPSFINSLTRRPNGLYSIPTSYDRFFTVMEQCAVASTRKKLYQIFMNRGYPQNEITLKRFIGLSDRLASLLGYESFAHYSLEEQMAKTPQVVKQFITAMYDRSLVKATSEMKLITKDLPTSVVLSDGKLQPWDLSYALTFYKKQHLMVDEVAIAQYFPLEHTLAALFKIYEIFFSVCFKPVPRGGFWHDDVQALAVYRKGKYIGVLLLDIHPRPNKFSHAGQVTIVPSVQEPSEQLRPAVIVLLANFPQESREKPAVLSRQEVRTFFHECGHALHALLGSTEFASLSGTSTKGDFVEMPSQMLEEWILDPVILRAISSHRETHKPLPEDLIKKIVNSKHFETGDYMLRQIFLADVSLSYYLPGADKDVAALWKALHEKWRSTLVFDASNRGYCSFPHIMGYGPRYYGYLWSKVFALDLFSAIKPHGLCDPTIGARYVDTVIAKGGSEDPMKLITAFLGRAPSTDAFFKDLGL